MIKPALLRWQKGYPKIKDFPADSICLIISCGCLYAIRSSGRDNWLGAYSKNSGIACNQKVIKHADAYLPVDMSRLDKIIEEIVKK